MGIQRIVPPPIHLKKEGRGMKIRDFIGQWLCPRCGGEIWMIVGEALTLFGVTLFFVAILIFTAIGITFCLGGFA